MSGKDPGEDPSNLSCRKNNRTEARERLSTLKIIHHGLDGTEGQNGRPSKEKEESIVTKVAIRLTS